MVKKTYFLSIVLLFICADVFSQNIELIDSLRGKLSSSHGENKFELLNDLAWQYRSAYPDSTIYYAQLALELGKELRIPIGLAKTLNFIGVAYNYKGNRLEAYNYYDDALKLATLQRDSLQIAHANNNLGRLFFEQGLLSRSYEYFVQTQIIFQNLNDSSGLAYTYQSLARLYKTQSDNIKSEDHYLKANDLRLALGNTPDITSAYIQTGRFYQDNNEEEKALHYLNLADSTASSINDAITLAEIKTFKARSLLKQGNFTEAENLCTEGLKVILELNHIRMQPQTFLILGEILLASNKIQEAKSNFVKALEVANRSKDLTSKMDAHFFLWKVSEMEKNRSEQMRNHNEYLVLKDSLKDLDLARQVERFQFEIEIERRERENELLKANQISTEAIIQQQRLQNIILIIVTFFISLLVILQWRNINKRKEVNEQLASQNEFIENQRKEIIQQNEKLSKRNQQLSDINHEKDTLMGIVAHDLKSPLNRIKGIVSIMEMEGGLTADQQNYIALMKKTAQSGLFLIKDLLDVHMLEENVQPNFVEFDIREFLKEKAEALIPSAEAKGIQLTLHEVEMDIVKTDPTYLARIIDNLLSNAIKFSYRNSHIDVRADKTEETLWISIKDQGPGFSEQDKALIFQKFKKLSAQPTGGEISHGLGLAIVKILVDRLNGSIELISEQGKGSEFIIHIPVKVPVSKA
ncbi:MAG: ATP-binding protein [Cyclobacteriaceae bacterium]